MYHTDGGVASVPVPVQRPNRRLWQQMARGREDLSNGVRRGGTSVWECFVGMGEPMAEEKVDEEKKVADCEAMSECSTVDTLAAWPCIHAEDAELAERVAALLLHRPMRTQ